MARTEAAKIMRVNKKPEAKFQEIFCKWLESLQCGFVHEISYTGTSYYVKKKYLPDVFFYTNRGTYAFELKSNVGKTNRYQKACHARLKQSGVMVSVVPPKKFEEFKNLFAMAWGLETEIINNMKAGLC